MNTPFKNRRERIEFVIAKQGVHMLENMSYMTDREIKKYADTIYPIYKDRPDYIEKPTQCIRCETEVLWQSDCGCGINRAIFNEEMWKEDIESNSDHFEKDYAFSKERGIEMP